MNKVSGILQTCGPLTVLFGVVIAIVHLSR
jgi:hypothetical protein